MPHCIGDQLDGDKQSVIHARGGHSATQGFAYLLSDQRQRLIDVMKPHPAVLNPPVRELVCRDIASVWSEHSHASFPVAAGRA